jgi:hypothetical protein
MQLEQSRPPQKGVIAMTNSTHQNKRYSVPSNLQKVPDWSSLAGLIQCPSNDPGICKHCNEAYNPSKCPLERTGFLYKINFICGIPPYANVSFTGCEWGRTPKERRLFFTRSDGTTLTVPECTMETLYKREDRKAVKVE